MGKVVFSGHGSFDPSTYPPSTTVPDNTEIHFYTENLKELLDSYGGDIESMSPAFDSVSPSQSVYAGGSVPNYTLYDPEDLNIQSSPADVDQIRPGADHLARVLDSAAGVIEASAVAEAVGCHVQHTHDYRPPVGVAKPGMKVGGGHQSVR